MTEPNDTRNATGLNEAARAGAATQARMICARDIRDRLSAGASSCC